MDLSHATAGIDASGRGIVRGNRLARVKFVALPIEATPGNALGEARFPGGRAVRSAISYSASSVAWWRRGPRRSDAVLAGFRPKPEAGFFFLGI
jgi:hypothetical protein